MLLACCVLLFLMVALTLVWILKGFMLTSTAKAADIDISAFRNVLSLEDNRVLRERLSEAQYRQLKRARVRTAQEYVRAMAANCSVIVAVVRAKAAETHTAEISLLVSDALRIRLLCLGFWIMLWAEFVFPNLEIRPTQIVGGYERLRLAADRCLRSRQASSPAL